MKLYKYRTFSQDEKIRKRVFHTIKTGEFWFNGPESMNDLFEFHCFPTLKTQNERDSWFDFLSKNAPSQAGLDSRGFRNIDQQIQKLFIIRFFKVFMELIKKDIKFCSFSKNPENPLMWCHYAEAGKGICLEVTTDPIVELVGVNYVDKLPEISLSDLNKSDKEITDLRNKMLAYKHIDWKYEEEVRALFLNSSTHGCGVRVGKVSKIIIGSKMEDRMVNEIENFVLENGIDADIEVGSIRFHEIEFGSVRKTMPLDDFKKYKYYANRMSEQPHRMTEWYNEILSIFNASRY